MNETYPAQHKPQTCFYNIHNSNNSCDLSSHSREINKFPDLSFSTITILLYYYFIAFYLIFTAQRYASAVYAAVVCLSVCH